MKEQSEDYCTDQCYSCQSVVVRTYCGFLACGGNDPSAFRTAVTVLCLRHPERTLEENTELASVWISQAIETCASSQVNGRDARPDSH
jgi:hypothetical protein